MSTPLLTTMTRKLLLTLLASQSLVALFGATIPTADHAAIAQAVLATNADMLVASNRMDVDAMFEFIVDRDETTIVQNGVVFRDRAQAREVVARGMQGVAGIERRFENPRVTVVSPTTALLVSEGSLTATLRDGRTVSNRFAVSLVFVLEGDRWKILHGHYSMPIAQ